MFFSSDDSLYKTEVRKLTIPRIEIEQTGDPVFRLEITDFSEPNPTNVVLRGEIDIKQAPNKSWKSTKSISLDVKDSETATSTTNTMAELSRITTSLQDLSSSTSSLASACGVHESNLDLSQDTPDRSKEKNWRSPNEFRRQCKVKISTKRFEDIFGNRIVLSATTSYPNLCSADFPRSKKERFNSLESLTFTETKRDSKLSQEEQTEVMKVLQDWSLNGSSSGLSAYKLKKQRALELPSTECLNLIGQQRETAQEKKSPFSRAYYKYYQTNIDVLDKDSNDADRNLRYGSVPELHPRPLYVMKYKSESCLDDRSLDAQFYHECKFRNCIFNKTFLPSAEALTESVNASNNWITNSSTRNRISNHCSISVTKSVNGTIKRPEHQEEQKSNSDSLARCGICTSDSLNCSNSVNGTIKAPVDQEEEEATFGSLARCGSLERLSLSKDKEKEKKKFPEAYIVRRSEESKARMGKRDWKSCSDLKRHRVIQKCCRNARRTCPILKSNASPRTQRRLQRKAQSCANFDEDAPYRGTYAARVKSVCADLFGEEDRKICDFSYIT